MRTVLATVLLMALVAGGSTGCVAVAAGAAGAATYAYIAGNAEGTVDAPPARVEEAAVATFRELGIELEKVERDQDDGRITIAGKGPKQPVRVTVRPEGEVSRLWVRVGRTGDEQYSRTVYERIAARL